MPPPLTPDRKPTADLFVDVTIAASTYRLPLSVVLGVSGEATPARLPGAARGVVGLIAIRGRLVVVFDPAVLMGHAPTAAGSQIVLADHGGTPVGLLVEAITVDDLVVAVSTAPEVGAGAEPEGAHAAAPITIAELTAPMSSARARDPERPPATALDLNVLLASVVVPLDEGDPPPRW